MLLQTSTPSAYSRIDAKQQIKFRLAAQRSLARPIDRNKLVAAICFLLGLAAILIGGTQ